MNTKDTTTNYVYMNLKKALYERFLAPGTSLTERSVCETYGVGRTPVRAALMILAEEGFVEIIPNRGAFVKTATRKQFEDYYEVRDELEILALKKGIDHFIEEDFKQLEQLLEKEEDAYRQADIQAYLDTIGEFYSILISKSGNDILKQEFNNIYQRMHILLILYDHFDKSEKLDSLEAHENIIKALKKKDIDELQTIIKKHSKNVINNLEIGKCAIADLQKSLKIREE